MKHFDTDGNGTLDKLEWMAMFSALDEGNTDTAEDWAATFHLVDAGEDGKIRACCVDAAPARAFVRACVGARGCKLIFALCVVCKAGGFSLHRACTCICMSPSMP
jgi:hypothetical protein